MSVTVRVDLGDRGYPIVIGSNVLAEFELAPFVTGSQAFIVTNEAVAAHYLDPLQQTLAGKDVEVAVIGEGETNKTLANYAEVIDRLVAARHNRSTTVIALGGGIVGDLAGFVAATYQRGVGFVQIPTTLLAQVDASVGGKTAVNHPTGKNLIGAFYQPRCVVADVGTFATLPPREFVAGLAEVIKYGVIFDPEFFAWLERHLPDLLRHDEATLVYAVQRSCEIKAEVVAEDERETGLRAILNFGHTFGHAIETLTGYDEFLHGEAVAVGMVMAADLSARSGRISGADAARIKTLIDAAGLPSLPPQLGADAMLSAMGMDKKVIDGRLRLILATAIGSVEVTDDVDADSLAATLTAGEALCRA